MCHKMSVFNRTNVVYILFTEHVKLWPLCCFRFCIYNVLYICVYLCTVCCASMQMQSKNQLKSPAKFTLHIECFANRHQDDFEKEAKSDHIYIFRATHISMLYCCLWICCSRIHIESANFSRGTEFFFLFI